MATFSASVKSSGGHCNFLLISDDDNRTIRSIQDKGTIDCALPEGRYRVEWHFFSGDEAKYEIAIKSSIGAPHFPFSHTYTYAMSHNDMGGFYFTV